MSGNIVAIIGETGSGKSMAALALAKVCNGEIINADSWAVYRGFDIGTAKPTITERKRIPHHLLDVADPLKGFNAALYKHLANEAIKDILSRGKMPILAGGTGLYIDSVLYDYQFLPAVSAAVRDSRNRKALEELLEEAEKTGIDLTGIDVHNKRRVIRALEAGGRQPIRSEMRPETLIIGIANNRESLQDRITARVDVMLEKGLEHEVAGLVKKYGWDIEPMKGIGYAQWREYFEGSVSLGETRQRIISSTIGLAKRQRTWFKRNNGIQWVDHPSNIVEFATTKLNNLDY